VYIAVLSSVSGCRILIIIINVVTIAGIISDSRGKTGPLRGQGEERGEYFNSFREKEMKISG
jgi:hypothetical protein